MVTVFDEDEPEYLRWLGSHREGFVINTARTSGSQNPVLHQSRCPHISVIESQPPGAFTNRTIKVCADDMPDLQDWIMANRPGAVVRYCKTCDPPAFPPLPLYGEEIDGEQSNRAAALYEGAKKSVVVNAYERNSAARKQCVEHYGLQCAVCGFSFKAAYGQIGADFIHVHHLKALAEVDGRYQIDPIQDLRPVCPNCHAMLHRRPKQPYTIEELQGIMRKQRMASG